MKDLRGVRTTIIIAAAIVMMVAVLPLLASGCGGNTPTSAATDMMQLITDHKYGEVYDSFSSDSPVRAQINRDDFVAQMESSFPAATTISEFTVTEEKIDGDKATVNWTAKISTPDGQEEPLNDKFELVLEDGTWKVSQ